MLTATAVKAVVRHPSLWVTAAGAAVALAPHGWWKRPPFLPRPDPEVVRWRLTTAYGSADEPIDADDLVAYLRWRKRSVARGP